MSHIYSKLQNLSGKKFANVDFCQGYLQLGLHEDSQKMILIMTPIVMYSPTRVPQDGKDSGTHFQSVISDDF